MSAMFTNNFNAFRIYDSDAGEAASTPFAAQDTNYTIDATANVSFQLRTRIDEVGGADGTTMDDYAIEYSKNSGAFVALTTTDSGDGIRAVAAGLTNDAATTNRATNGISDPGSGSFVAGEQSSDGVVDDMQLTTANFTEQAYGIEFVSVNVADTDTFDFQFSAPSVSNNNVTPRLTISKGAAGQNIAVGQATETNLAKAIIVAGAIALSVGQAPETDAAQTIAPLQPQTISISQVLETGTVQSIAVVPGITLKAVGQATETDLAQTVTPLQAQNIPVGQISETNVAQTIAPLQLQTVAVGQVAESGTARAIAVIRYSPFFEITLSANIASGGENTTDRLTGGGTHGGGRIQDDKNPADTVDLGANESGEWAWVIGAAGAINGTQYSFRLVLADGTVLDTYTVEPKITISSDQSIVVGQATETGLAQPISPVPGAAAVSVSQVIETDIAQTITPLPGGISISVGQVLESNTSQSIASLPGVVNISVGQAAETDTAQALTVSQATLIAVGQATETALSQSISALPGVISLSVGQANETDAAQVVTPQQGAVISVGQAVETDTSQTISPVPGASAITVGRVAETNTAQTVTPIPSAGQFHKIFTVDYAGLPTNSFAYGIPELSGIVIGDGYQMDLLTTPDSHSVSGDSEGVITIGGTLTQPQTIDYTIYDYSDSTIGLPGTITVLPETKVISVAQVTETDTAQAINPVPGAVTVSVAQVTETDTAQSISPQQGAVIAVNQAAETDTAQAISPVPGLVNISVNQVTETDTAKNITPQQGTVISIGQVSETDTAQTISQVPGTATISVGQALETDTALSVSVGSSIITKIIIPLYYRQLMAQGIN